MNCALCVGWKTPDGASVMVTCGLCDFTLNFSAIQRAKVSGPFQKGALLKRVGTLLKHPFEKGRDPFQKGT